MRVNNTIKKVIKASVSLIFIFVFCAFSQSSVQGAKQGLEICLTSVIPSLFPFMVVTSYLMKSEAFSFLGKLLGKISQALFRLPKEGLIVYIFSLIGGYPVGAKLIADGIGDGTFSKNQGKRMMLFCVNSGPAFVINVVGIFMLNSKKAGLVLLFGISLASFVMGLMSRIFAKDEKVSVTNFKRTDENILVSSVNDSLRSMAGICGWILIFTSVRGILMSFPINEDIKIWLNMLGEVTSGCKVSVKSYPLSVTAFVLGFAGVCIHLQIMKFISLTGLRYLHFFVCRVLHGGLAFAISFVLFKIFPCDVEVFSNMGEIVPKAVSVSVPASLAVIFLFAIVILDLAPKAKV